jgi:Arc/MetJ-type ribon-helix-helix transcriptional regulator
MKHVAADGGAMKATSLRLSDEDSADLAAVAYADEMTQSEVVRLALREYFDRRRQDDDFQQRLQTYLDRNRKIVERLSRKSA